MTIQKDLHYLSAGVPELENYLLSTELYYPMGNDLPQLTLGGMLLSLARAGGEAAKFETRIEAIRSKWQAAWDAKASREVRARSDLWMDYLEEYRDDPKSGARLYAQNVRYRAMLGLLGQREHDSDHFVRSIFKEGEFVWEKECAQNFQRDTFWYLFGTLQE